MVIRAIVCAKNEEEALDSAKSIFDRLVENQHPFDYYTTFDEGGTASSGKARWGSLPVATKASSKEGKKLIEDGMKATENESFENMKKIRHLVKKYSDKELLEEGGVDKKKDTDLYLFRYFCHQIGRYEGSPVFLYDDNGCGIRTRSDLKYALEKQKGYSLWVVPADVHY